MTEALFIEINYNKKDEKIPISACFPVCPDLLLYSFSRGSADRCGSY
jgi:hypothetical protein